MADFAAFRAKWATLSGTTAQKLAAINAETVVRNKSWALTGTQLWNAVDEAEFNALSAANKSKLTELWGLYGAIDISAGTRARTLLTNLFGAGTITRANIVALVTETVPWYIANGYSGPFNDADVSREGLS